MKIRIKYGEDTSPKIESSDHFEHSIFSDVYHKAYTILGSIIESSNNGNPKERPYSNRPLEAPNNIIAFTGDRGSGKTSTMLSFIMSLPENKTSSWDEYIKTDLKGYTFEILDVIDPTTFTEAHNVLEVVLGKMFSQFKHKIENRERSCFSNANMVTLKRDLFSKFEQVRKDLYYQDCKEKEDSIDQFTSYSCVTSLRNDICDLVKYYIRFMNDDQTENRKLVIPIDDLDLNIKNAYPMLEQIRKYLMCPDIVIVMALSLDQMKDACILNFLNDYQHKLQYYNEELHKNHILDLSDRYLIKYLPLSHRIHVLGIDSLRKIDIEIDESRDKTISGISLAEFLLQEILTHTGYLFYNRKGMPSPIVPTNLREMIMLLNMLHTMKISEDIKPDSEEYLNRLIWNRSQFKRYFFQNWFGRHLKEKQRIKLCQLMEEPAETFNGQIVELIKNEFETITSKIKDIERATSSKPHPLLDDRNFLYNYSLSDSMCLLNEIETRVKETQELNIIFAIKTIISMRLYEAYDLLTFPFIQKIKESEAAHFVNELNISSSFDYYTNYWKLKGRTLFSPYIKILPGYKDGNERLDYREIDIQVLRGIKEINRPLYQFLFLTTQFYTTKEINSDFRTKEKQSLNIGLCEFNDKIRSGYFHVLLIFDRLLEIYNLMDFDLKGINSAETKFWNLFFNTFKAITPDTTIVPISFNEYYQITSEERKLILMEVDESKINNPGNTDKIKLQEEIIDMLLEENSLLTALFCHIQTVRENLYSTLIFRNTAYWDMLVKKAKERNYGVEIWEKYQQLFREISTIQLKVYGPGNITFEYLKPLTNNLKRIFNDGSSIDTSLIIQFFKLNKEEVQITNISKEEYSSLIIAESGNLSLTARNNSILALLKDMLMIETEQKSDAIKKIIEKYRSQFRKVDKLQNEDEKLNNLNTLLYKITEDFKKTL